MTGAIALKLIALLTSRHPLIHYSIFLRTLPKLVIRDAALAAGIPEPSSDKPKPTVIAETSFVLRHAMKLMFTEPSKVQALRVCSSERADLFFLSHHRLGLRQRLQVGSSENSA